MPRARSTHAPRYAGASTRHLSGPHLVKGKRRPGQKGIIVMLAKKAFAFRGETGDFDVWRHEQIALKVGVSSLTECTQADYLPLVAHFNGLAGEGGNQFEAAYRDLDEIKRQQRHLLEVALSERDLVVEYAEKICRVQYISVEHSPV